MKYQILCDCFCDFTATERLSSVFQKVPAVVRVSGQALIDGKDFRQQELLHALEADSYELKVDYPDEAAYRPLLNPNAQAYYLVTASAALFDQYDVANRVRREILQRAPDACVHVFNTRSCGVGELLAARRISQLERSGCSFRQIVERVESELLSVSTYLLPASADTLRQSGLTAPPRWLEPSRAVYAFDLAGTLVRICGAVSDNRLEQKLAAVVKQRETAGKTCLISYCGCPDRARRAAQVLQKNGSFSTVRMTDAGAVNALLLQRGGISVAF